MASNVKSESDWQAEGDAHSVAEAAAVQADPTRLKAAKAAAKRMAADEKLNAKKAQARSTAMTSLAGTNTKPMTKPKPATKPKAKPKPAAKPKVKPKPAKAKPASKKAAPKPKATPRRRKK